MYKIPIARKKCATCRWWSGRRKLVFVGANPQFISVDARTKSNVRYLSR